MKAELIKNPRAKQKKATEIVRLYNEFSDWSEYAPLKNHRLAVIAHVPGVKGGVWLERLGGKVNVIYFAAFERQHQGKGCLTACLNAIREHYVIDGVQVNLTDNHELWQKLGFTRQDMVNMVPTYTYHSEKEFRQLCAG